MYSQASRWISTGICSTAQMGTPSSAKVRCRAVQLDALNGQVPRTVRHDACVSKEVFLLVGVRCQRRGALCEVSRRRHTQYAPSGARDFVIVNLSAPSLYLHAVHVHCRFLWNTSGWRTIC